MQLIFLCQYGIRFFAIKIFTFVLRGIDASNTNSTANLHDVDSIHKYLFVTFIPAASTHSNPTQSQLRSVPKGSNFMRFAPQKYTLTHFTRRSNLDLEASIRIGDRVIAPSLVVRVLGYAYKATVGT